MGAGCSAVAVASVAREVVEEDVDTWLAAP